MASGLFSAVLFHSLFVNVYLLCHPHRGLTPQGCAPWPWTGWVYGSLSLLYSFGVAGVHCEPHHVCDWLEAFHTVGKTAWFLLLPDINDFGKEESRSHVCSPAVVLSARPGPFAYSQHVGQEISLLAGASLPKVNQCSFVCVPILTKNVYILAKGVLKILRLGLTSLVLNTKSSCSAKKRL